MTATAMKEATKAKSQGSLGDEVLVIEQTLSNMRGILALTSKLKEALIERGVGPKRQPVSVKVLLSQEASGSSKATEETRFDPRAAGLEMVEKLKTAEGGAWSGNELNKRFGLTPATLHGRRKARRIVVWRDPKHAFFYPRWQFTEAGALRPGIEKILKIFNSADEWRVMRYFLSPRRQLDGKKPLDLLRAGEVEKVVAHAQDNAAEGSW